MPFKDPAARRAYDRLQKKAHRKLSDKFSTAARHANQRAQRYGVLGRIDTATVRAVVDGASCRYCGAADRLGLDHVVPMSDGGENVPANLVAACHSCNARKRRKASPWSWTERHEACVECGLTERPHSSGGRCSRCHQREVRRVRRAA